MGNMFVAVKKVALCEDNGGWNMVKMFVAGKVVELCSDKGGCTMQR